MTGSLPLILASVIGAVLLISLFILVWWLIRKKGARKEAVAPQDRTTLNSAADEEAAKEFLYNSKDVSKQDIPEDPMASAQLYQPAPGNSPVNDAPIYQVSEEEDRYHGHDVEVKELPTPLVEEEVDTSWVDLDVKRELKHILHELDRKNVNCYDILNIPKNSDSKKIHKAYRNLASVYHPDRGAGGRTPVTNDVMERIREINYSKEILLDPNMRALHDQMIREKEMNEPPTMDEEMTTLDPTTLEMFPEPEEQEEEIIVKPVRSAPVDTTRGRESIGVLFFRKWEEGSEGFGKDFLDYIIQLDDQGYLDYGQVLKADLNDLDEISRLKKISNFSQAVNNTLFDVWVRPPFYYMAVPVLSREYVQQICDMLKNSFNVESIFFTYPWT
ncbi:MAG: DnaJ domain-containing protein [Candidatus Thermoplasmatota archaeon]|nr:DnaJ domain-containing protein [Candidatus Thermoplasmatota archaeon]